MAVSGLTAFQLPHLQANLIYLVVGGPCVLTWLYLGESLQNFLIGNQKLERARICVVSPKYGWKFISCLIF